MSTSLEIYPTDTVLVAAPRPYEASFRARVPSPLRIIPSADGTLVVGLEDRRVTIRRDDTLTTRIPPELAQAIAARVPQPVLYALDFADMQVLRKLLVKLVDDPELLVDNAHGLLLRGDEFARELARRDRWDWRSESPTRYRSAEADASVGTIVRRWLAAPARTPELSLALMSLRDDGFDALAGLLATRSLDRSEQFAALKGLSRLTFGLNAARHAESRSIARDIAARTDDVAVRSLAIGMITGSPGPRGAPDEEGTLSVVRAALERDLGPRARQQAEAFLRRSAETRRAVPRDSKTLLEKLEASIVKLLRARRAANDVSIKRSSDGVERLFVTRVVGDRTRTARITLIGPERNAPWDFELFLWDYSRVPSESESEGRWAGQYQATLRTLALWLLDWVPREDLPPFG